MAKPPRPLKPKLRATDTAPVDKVIDRAIVAKPADPRQIGLFDLPLPGWMRPCLPTLVDKPPSGPQWVHEIKWDGYRVSVYVEAGKVTIRTRKGHDWTRRFPAIARAAAALKVRSAVLDGEAVILDKRGRSSFAELQADLDKHGSERAVLYAFDLLFLDGEALWKEPLYVRRLSLASIIPARSGLLLSEDYTGDGAVLFRIACEQGLEGIVSKRLDAPYRGGRGRSWLKTKCVLDGEFVIIGYQPGSGARRATVGALHVATLDGQVLRYAGVVGTGFGEAVAAMLRERLDAIAAPRCVVAGLKVKGAVWVVPDLRAEIAYRGVTTAGELRHASFKGLAGRHGLVPRRLRRATVRLRHRHLLRHRQARGRPRLRARSPRRWRRRPADRRRCRRGGARC